jgi:hypothetical protein
VVVGVPLDEAVEAQDPEFAGLAFDRGAVFGAVARLPFDADRVALFGAQGLAEPVVVADWCLWAEAEFVEVKLPD